jgi:hypothetical protein
MLGLLVRRTNPTVVSNVSAVPRRGRRFKEVCPNQTEAEELTGIRWSP